MPAIFGHRMEQPSFSDGTTSSVRKLTEDLLKTRINEEIEEDEPFHGYGRSGSYDRKSSNNSVILTEDTDSFIVGDKVWVGGTKPGRIMFIGETQFASGDWAGIVLDDPIGKNDGSVGGTRYFQCEPKKGVFSRLGRLSRYPIAVPSPPLAPSPSPPLSTASAPSSKRATPPPIPRTPPLVSSSSPAPNVSGEPKIGDRVIVMSGQGSKIGILRYRGHTSFAPGEWCGVELDDPIGKNDGSVEGIRYFECQPKFGLFAPAAKVSKSPAPDRRPSCQIHHNVRRASSRESLTSVTSRASTVASTASRKPAPRPSMSALGTPRATPQELLKSKQEQIEKLLKERELDRARVVKAAEQTEEAEKQLNLLKAEYELFRMQMLKKIQETEDESKKLLQEKTDLVNQLEDWKFRAEEESVTKSTLEEEQEDLQKCADAWRKAFAKKEEENKDLLLKVEELNETKKTIELLKEEVEKMRKLAVQNENELKKELIDTIDRANRMEQNYNEIQTEFESLESLKNEITPLQSKITQLEAALSESESKRIELENISREANGILEDKKNAINTMKTQVACLENKLKEAEHFNKLLGEEDRELKARFEQMAGASAQIEQLEQELFTAQHNYKTVSDENKALKRDISELQVDKSMMQEEQDLLQKSVDDWKKTLAEKEAEIKTLFLQVDELNRTRQLMISLKDETESFRKKSAEIENELKKELIETIDRANRMEENYNSILNQMKTYEKQSSDEIASLNGIIGNLETSLAKSNDLRCGLENDSKETEEKLKNHEKIIDNMKSEIHDLEYKLKEAETCNKLLGEGEQQLKSQCAEMSNLLTQVSQLKEDLSEAQSKYTTSIEQNETLKRELHEFQTSSNNKLLDIDKKYNNDIENLKKKLEEYSSELSNKEKKLSEEKIKFNEHEREYSSLQKELIDLKNSLEINQNNLNVKETEICSLKIDLEEVKSKLAKSTEISNQSKVEYSLKVEELIKELEECRSTIKSLETDRNNLTSNSESEVRKLKEKLSSAEHKNSTLTIEVESYRSESEAKATELNELQEKYNILDVHCNNLGDNVESKMYLIKQLQAQVNDSEITRNEKDNLLEEFQRKIEEEEKLIANLRAELCNVEQNYRSVLKENDSLKNVLVKSEESNSHLQEEKNQLLELLDHWQQKFNEKENELKLCIEELSETKDRISLLKAESDIIREKSSLVENELRKHLEEMQKKANSAEQCLLDIECLIKSLAMSETNVQLEAESKEIDPLEYKQILKKKIERLVLDSSEFTEAKNTISSINKENEVFRKQAKDNENKLRKEISETIQQLRLVEEENRNCQIKLKEEHERASIEVAHLNERLKKLEDTLSTSEHEKTELELNINLKENTLKMLGNVVEELRMEIQGMESKLNEVNSYNESLAEEKEELKKQCTELNNIFALLSDEQAAKKPELADAEDIICKVREEHKRLYNQLKEVQELLDDKEQVIKTLEFQIKELNEMKAQMISLKKENDTYKIITAENENEMKNELVMANERATISEETCSKLRTDFDIYQSQSEKEILSLKKMISKLDISLEETRVQKEQLENNLTDLLTRIKLQEREINDLKSNVNNLESKLAEDTKFVEDLNSLLKKKSEMVTNLLAQIEQFKEDLLKAENAKKEYVKLNEALKQELIDLQLSSDNKMIHLDEIYKTNIEIHRKKLEESYTELKNMEYLLSEEKIKKDQLEKKQTTLKENLKGKEEENHILKKNILETKVKLEKALENSAQSKESYELDIKTYKHKFEECNFELNNMENLLSKEKLKSDELEKEVSSLRESLLSTKIELEKALEYSTQSKDCYERDIESYKQQFEECYAKLKNKENLFSEEKMKNDKLEKEISAVMESLLATKVELDKSLERSIQSKQSYEGDIETYKQQFEICYTDLNNKETLLSEEKKRNDKLDKEVSSLMESLQATKAKLEEALERSAQSKKSYEGDIETYKRKLEEYHTELKNKEQLITVEKVKCDELERKVSSLIDDLSNNKMELEKAVENSAHSKESYESDLKNLKKQLEEYFTVLKIKNDSLTEQTFKSDELEKEVSSLREMLLTTKVQLEKAERNGSDNVAVLTEELEKAKSAILNLETDKENTLKLRESENEILKNNILSLENRILVLQCDLEQNKENICSKNIDFARLQNEYNELDSIYINHRLEFESKSSYIKTLELRIEELTQERRVLLQKEVELENLRASMTILSEEKQILSEELSAMKQKLDELAELKLEGNKESTKKINELTEELEKLKETNEQVNSQLAKMSENSTITKEELEKKCKELTFALESTEKGSTQEVIELNGKLKKMEKLNADLLKEISEKKELAKQLETVVINLNSQLETAKKDKAEQIEVLKKDCQNQKNILEAQLKVVLSEKEIAETKSKQLSNEISNLKASQKVVVDSEGNECLSWKEEKELADSQINFLNSIIVDLQNKNDDFNKKIQELESRETLVDVKEVKKKKKEITPRMFCDICDVFDAHETEDCPRQASSDSPPPQQHAPQPRGVVRPFCNYCEVFGHDTDDCDDTEMF